MIDDEMPLVTVIMPTYNQDKFIDRAIHSLKKQTLSNWELIIVNDGSTDLTYQLAQKYQEDKRINYLQHTSNQGLGASINHALAIAKADFICYLPSDDVYYKDHLQSLNETFKKFPGTVLAYSSFIHHYNRKAEGILNMES